VRDATSRRYGGKGVRKAVGTSNDEIASALRGTSAEQRAIDTALVALDGTTEFLATRRERRPGVSMGTAHRPAAGRRVSRLLMSTWRPRAGRGARARADHPRTDDEHPHGGAHADTNVDFQEFMVMPVGLRRSPRPPRRRRDVPRAARLLKKPGLATARRRRGRIRGACRRTRRAVELVLEAIGAAGYAAGKDMFIALDVAASEFWDDAAKHYDAEEIRRRR